MKNLMKYRFFQNALTALFILLAQITQAQDSTRVTTTHTIVTTNTLEVPIWAWVAGGVVVLVIIIALVSRGSKRTDKIIVKRDV